MVHNGIEYGSMQLIAETYELMKRGLGLSDDELHEVYLDWNRSEVNAYLLEITATIFCEQDQKTGKRLIDVILDEATQKGTGRWTSQDAMDLQVPAPTIDSAVAMRNLTILKDERTAASQLLGRSGSHFQGERASFLDHLRGALYAAIIITFAQGMADLQVDSRVYDYNLNLETVARIWRGGCIIRAGLLKDIRSAWLPANLIQAQRDYFGAHTYERIDGKGVFHTQWEES